MYKLLFLFLLVGCFDNEQTPPPPKVQTITKFYEYELIVIDSCEYLVFGRNSEHYHVNTHTITHKGNCKNPIHRESK